MVQPDWLTTRRAFHPFRSTSRVRTQHSPVQISSSVPTPDDSVNFLAAPLNLASPIKACRLRSSPLRRCSGPVLAIRQVRASPIGKGLCRGQFAVGMLARAADLRCPLPTIRSASFKEK